MNLIVIVLVIVFNVTKHQLMNSPSKLTRNEPASILNQDRQADRETNIDTTDRIPFLTRDVTTTVMPY